MMNTAAVKPLARETRRALLDGAWVIQVMLTWTLCADCGEPQDRFCEAEWCEAEPGCRCTVTLVDGQWLCARCASNDGPNYGEWDIDYDDIPSSWDRQWDASYR